MNIRPVGPELFLAGGRTDGWTDRQTDKQTDMKKLIVAFRNLAIAPNKMTSFQSCSSVTTLVSKAQEDTNNILL